MADAAAAATTAPATGLPLDAAAGLRAAAFIGGVAVAAELAQAFWVYGAPGFRAIRDTIDMQSKKIDALRAAGASPSSAAARAGAPSDRGGRARKADRLENSVRMVLLKEMGAARLKSGVVAMLALVITLQVGGRAFSGRAVARLPFEPFPLLRGVAHRGLEGHALTDAGWFILFTLIQTGVRPVLAKLLDGGPSRRMNDLTAQWGGMENVAREARGMSGMRG